MWDEGLAMIHKEFEKYDNVILSDENIWHASNGRKFPFWSKLMEDAKEYDYQVKIVVYIRRQDTLANSWTCKLMAQPAGKRRMEYQFYN